MATPAVRPYRTGVYAVVLLLLLLLSALHFISDAVLNSESLSRWFIPLLIFIVSGLIAVAGVIAWNLLRLLGEYRRKAAGARLMARVLVLFVVMGLAPVGIVYYYSLQFLMHGIDSWFDVQIDKAMKDALDLNQATLSMNKRILLRFTKQMLEGIEDTSQAGLALTLGDLRNLSGAIEMALVDKGGRLIASSHVNPDVLMPDEPGVGVIQQVLSGENYVGFSPYGESGELHVRCLVADIPRGILMQAIYPASGVVSELSEQVQDAYVAYKERAYLQDSIKFSFLLTLSLVLLVSVFAAAWAALFTVRRLVAPITDIANGTRAVAQGEYDKQLPQPKYRDELGFLVASFNAMTRRIAQARDMAAQSKQELEAQHRYLETVLAHLSTGVMALDGGGNIRTANQAADQILRVEASKLIDQPIDRLVEQDRQLESFVESIYAGLADEHENWQSEVVVQRSDGRQVLMCERTYLDMDDRQDAGSVVVFDDITTLIKAQRDAAWGEVARRLAHEIKNPLTPIQLSAERLRRKYLQKLVDDDKRVLDNATTTIVNQVEAMKSMVNAFSDYAKPSRIEPESLLIDEFVAEVLGLYGGMVVFQAAAPGLRIKGDPVRIRQVIHNLVKNAQEAVDGMDDRRISLSTRELNTDDAKSLELVVQDNGNGFDEDSLGQVFEPYVTSKVRGTGLGLAIVKKIVEEHGGAIKAENAPEGGARIIIKLPAI